MQLLKKPASPTLPRTHVVEPNGAHGQEGKEEERAPGGEALLEQRKRQRHQAAGQAVHAHREAHAPAAVPQGENLITVGDAVAILTPGKQGGGAGVEPGG